MIEGGEDLRDEGFGSEHHDEFGRKFDPFTRDFYIGHFPPDHEGLNIHNPQPGFRYYHALNPEMDGGSNVLHLANKYGAEIVGPDDPEYIGISRKHGKVHAGPHKAYGDVVTVRISQAVYDRVKEREQSENRDALAGIVEAYKDGDPFTGGKPTRYVGSDHGTSVEDL